MHPRLILSVGNFFSAAHFFLIVYIIAPYLALFMPAAQAGLVVSLGAIITLSVFPFMPRLVCKFGAKRLVIILAFLQSVNLFLLAGAPMMVLAIACIALSCALSPLIAYQLDLLLEATMRGESTTGRVRTAFLTAGNLALIMAPIAIGFLLDDSERYSLVFLVASLSLAPFIALFLIEPLPEGQPPVFSAVGMTCACIWKDADLRAAALGNAVLQFFYHLAPLYIPLYLHTVLGMPWEQLGWIFAIMLLPFVFVEYPAGWLADRYLGDKGMLIAGFLIAGVAFAAIGFVDTTTPVEIIVAILFISRIGAALVESMVESHFFRRVSERDANTISVFRMTRPLSALIAPVFASIILFAGNYLIFFLIAGALIAALGVIATIGIHQVAIPRAQKTSIISLEAGTVGS
ncbi:MAG: hypothetical protein AB199_01880 [Parcubacteria bacterium C7867-004]|nr:MAG: hypothetical protein AB199_01880 [Parcubacteria bacterium C7867-004]